ncbi:uncharacterized protein LOC142222112 isoform X2 [Haematobia irritans]|uniref:uncharacterized protein LOC142222112 isoform X2 n=1 Tax=Haematobia irritans TaxID=7368 RepID=UPI003F5057CC
MLLNSYGQPTILEEDDVNMGLAEWMNAPVILCNKDSLQERYFPINWKGTLYTSESIITSITESNIKLPWDMSYNKIPLLPHEVFNVTLQGGNNIKLTMMPLYDNMVYIIEDEYVKSLVCDNLTPKDIYYITHQKLVRARIKEGVDVLYINDGIYQESHNQDRHPGNVIAKIKWFSTRKPNIVPTLKCCLFVIQCGLGKSK